MHQGHILDASDLYASSWPAFLAFVAALTATAVFLPFPQKCSLDILMSSCSRVEADAFRLPVLKRSAANTAWTSKREACCSFETKLQIADWRLFKFCVSPRQHLRSRVFSDSLVYTDSIASATFLGKLQLCRGSRSPFAFAAFWWHQELAPVGHRLWFECLWIDVTCLCVAIRAFPMASTSPSMDLRAEPEYTQNLLSSFVSRPRHYLPLQFRFSTNIAVPSPCALVRE